MQNQKRNFNNMAMKSLEGQLRSLPKAKVSDSLKERLLSALPHRKAKSVRERHVQRRLGFWSFGTAAAAVFLFALLFVANYGPSGQPGTLIADLNDGPVFRLLSDHNNSLIEDTNHTDSNGLR